MKKQILLLVSIVALIFLPLIAFSQDHDNRFVSYTTDAAEIVFYWKDDNGQPLRSIQNLKSRIEGNNRQLLFAMNAGMYTPDNAPLGLYIENRKMYKRLNTASGSGNFHMTPNGVFYITKKNKAFICTTPDFSDPAHVKFATQSGPMLLIDGEIHPAFKQGSVNLNIRNGVGILPDNRVVFVISKQEINFYDFAAYFKGLNCKNALYLDGFVSRAYIPDSNWEQLDGNFGAIIGVTN